ncbi:antitoxin [Candidatus Albibeggiatoa sp. nov. BB20]|uniref:antitoxin n=1 Tax=Candidatus Albibeggiatoa sp. nov. BB20 TaxID=3162723 RepID=UPI00336532ED
MSNLKYSERSPTALLAEFNGAPIAILNHNKPTTYLIPSKTCEFIMECLEDYELAKIVEERRKEKFQAIEVLLCAIC